MFKTFIAGLILGLAAAGAAAYFVPAVNLHREASMISVRPNGGNSEMFHINLPADRILAGKNSVSGQMVFPEELEWPADAALQGAGTEIFKLRNRDDTVVGIAARIDNARDDSGPFVQWMIHLPARGSLFVGLNIQSSDDGSRNGRFVAGTREFEHMSGSMREAYNASVKTDDMGISGRIELETSLVRTAGDDR